MYQLYPGTTDTKQAVDALSKRFFFRAILKHLLAIRMRKIQEMGKHFGKGLWIGDLTEMREDKPSPGRHVHGRKKPAKKQ